MRNSNVTAVRVETEEIKISRNEAAVRLKMPRAETENENILRCERELKKVITYKYAFIKAPVIYKAENICDLGFGDIVSRDLVKALNNAKYAYIMGATIGIGADRLISRLRITSPAECFITDALASAAAESLCEYVDFTLRGSGKKPFRYSPGYGDMPLSYQKAVLDALNADYTLGITLNSSLLMTPMKSVTAIMGINPTEEI